jgi:Domain of unknown function (DUF4276)
MISIASIVEGHGDVAAVPILLRRIAWESSEMSINVPKPVRVPRMRLVKAGELERHVELAVRKANPCGVLILVDADDDCPKELAPELMRRAVAARGNVPIGVVLAKCEFEAWFLAAAESLVAKQRLPSNFHVPTNSEEIEKIRGAKERLGPGYSETRDQPSMTDLFDLASARRNSNSFDKCYREVVRLINELSKKEPQ